MGRFNLKTNQGRKTTLSGKGQLRTSHGRDSGVYNNSPYFHTDLMSTILTLGERERKTIRKSRRSLDGVYIDLNKLTYYYVLTIVN